MSQRRQSRRPMRGEGALPALLLAALLVGAAAAMVLAGGRGPDGDAMPTSAEVQGRIMSPFCPGLTVAECPSAESAELRRKIDAMVASGRTNKEIDAWFVANYGESALGRPRSLLAWLAPAAAVFMGLALVLAKLRGRVESPGSQPAGEALPPISPEQRRRLLHELRSYAREARE